MAKKKIWIPISCHTRNQNSRSRKDLYMKDKPLKIFKEYCHDFRTEENLLKR